MANFLKKAFSDMKESAKAQHEVDKANFEAAKAEAKANFEENKGHNTFAKAKADAKKSWDDAHMTPAEMGVKAGIQGGFYDIMEYKFRHRKSSFAFYVQYTTHSPVCIAVFPEEKACILLCTACTIGNEVKK